MDFDSVLMSAIAANTCVSEEMIRSFVSHPNTFLVNYGSFWCFADNNRNYPPRLLDEWFSCVVTEYMKYNRDIGLEFYPINKLDCKKRTSIDDLLSKHLSNKFILTADIEHFYDNISFDVIKDFIPPSIKTIIKAIYFNETGIGIKCGLRTSSYLADIAGNNIIDRVVNRSIHTNGFSTKVFYNRYCDDLLVSSSNRLVLQEIERILSAELEKNGLNFNRRKTKIKPINSNTILGRSIHDGKIIISKRRRNRARIKYYNALKAYENCNIQSLDSITDTLIKLESAIGLINYIGHYNRIDDNTFYKLREAYFKIQKLKREVEESPLVR
jgi:hypothetical protein